MDTDWSVWFEVSHPLSPKEMYDDKRATHGQVDRLENDNETSTQRIKDFN